MKIQLFIPEHKNKISQFEDYVPTSLQQLPSLIDASCDGIHIGNCHDFVELNYPEFLQLVVSKLRYNGKLIIEGVDVLSVCYALSFGNIDINEVQSLLFHGKQRCATGNLIADILKSLNLKISQHNNAQYMYSIVAKRTLNEKTYGHNL